MYYHEEYCSERVAQKINYEFEMFEFLHRRLESAFHESAEHFLPGNVSRLSTDVPSDEERVIFAMLESLLLHARVLRDFFYNDKPRDGDIMANHFASDWKLHRPPDLPYLFAHKLQLDKAVAHLTMKQLDYERGLKKWHVTAIHAELKELIDLFLSRLTDERRAWFAYKS